jgi:LPXTG-motif cell wall-anchored protein
MWGRQGTILLVGGYVFAASLAAPGLLFATESPEAPPADSDAPAPSVPPEPPDVQSPALQQQPGPQAPPAPDQAPPAPDQAPPAPDQAPPAPDETAKVTAPTPAGPTQTRTNKASARASATRTVAMRDIKFKPRNITIDPGDTVQWRNDDPERHNALGENGSFETPVIAEGETSSHTFNRKGSYPYFCSLHAGMDGRITVGASSGGGSGDSGGGSGGGGPGTGATGSSTAGSSTGSTGTTGTTSTSGSSSTSTLPATGSDLVWLALIGAGLLTLGAATALVARRVY